MNPQIFILILGIAQHVKNIQQATKEFDLWSLLHILPLEEVFPTTGVGGQAGHGPVLSYQVPRHHWGCIEQGIVLK